MKYYICPVNIYCGKICDGKDELIDHLSSHGFGESIIISILQMNLEIKEIEI